MSGGTGLPGETVLKDLTGDGVITEADLTIIGDSLPKALAYMSTYLKSGSFELDAKAGIRIGCDYVDYSKLFPCEGPVALTEKMIARRAPVTYSLSASYSFSGKKVIWKPFLRASTYRTLIAGIQLGF